MWNVCKKTPWKHSFINRKERYGNFAHNSSQLEDIFLNPFWTNINSPVVPVVDFRQSDSFLLLGTSKEASGNTLAIQLFHLILHQRNQWTNADHMSVHPKSRVLKNDLIALLVVDFKTVPESKAIFHDQSPLSQVDRFCHKLLMRSLSIDCREIGCVQNFLRIIFH